MERIRYKFADHHQSFWQLAFIQGASLGLPGFLVGAEVAKQLGTFTALTSIVIGNLILWTIGLSVISMTPKSSANAIENVKNYLGQFGAISAAIILIVAFLTWYTLQLESATHALESVLQYQIDRDKMTTIRIGGFLGIIIALISMKGIKIIKWTCCFSFPLLCAYLIYSFILISPTIEWHVSKHITSIYGITAIIAVILPGIINLPTFFRHSKSKADSILGLSMTIVFAMLFQIYSALIGVDSPKEIFSDFASTSILNFTLISSIIFIILSALCINLVNIYFASAGWELILSRSISGLEYALVGFIGTAVFAFILQPSLLNLLSNMTNSIIACLGIVLIIDYLIKTIVKHRPRMMEKVISNSCWFFGCIISLIVLFRDPNSGSKSILFGVLASAFSFILILFVEEIVWSIQKKSNDFNDSIHDMRKSINDTLKKFKK